MFVGVVPAEEPGGIQLGLEAQGLAGSIRLIVRLAGVALSQYGLRVSLKKAASRLYLCLFQAHCHGVVLDFSFGRVGFLNTWAEADEVMPASGAAIGVRAQRQQKLPPRSQVKVAP